MVPEASRANANEGILTDVQGIQRKSSPLGEYRGRSLGDSGTSEVSKTSEDKQGVGVCSQKDAAGAGKEEMEHLSSLSEYKLISGSLAYWLLGKGSLLILNQQLEKPRFVSRAQ